MVGKSSEESSFPRGAVLSTNTEPSKPVVLKKKPDKDLFSNKQLKTSKKAKKPKKRKDEKASIFDINTVSTLTYSQLSEGQVLLGFVCRVLEFELHVSLPGHLVGTVPITNISPTLTSRLRALAEGDEDGGEIPSLSNLYKEGQVVVVAVVSVTQTDARYSLVLSMSPARVGGGRVPGQGDIFCAAVSSKEDHGYIMDIGSTTVRGFVSNKAMGKVTNSPQVGSLMWTLVSRVEAGVVSLTPALSKVWGAELSNPTVHNLCPGSRVKGQVESHLGNGLKVTLKEGLVGYVHHEQLQGPVDTVESYAVGSEVVARVLYIVPTVNTVILTLREVRERNPFPDIKQGDLMENVIIERSQAKSVILRLGENTFGLVTARNLTEGREVTKKVVKKFPVGGKVTARVLALDYSSGLVICSLQKSKLAGVQRLDQLNIGQKITATVKSFVRTGLLVSVGPSLTGLVPSLFLSDVVLSKPELKYLPGDKIQCRVLKLNPDKNQLHLTSKPILVNNDNYTIVSDWSGAVPGTVTEGVVVKVGKEGLLVQLWGDMIGWVAKSQLSLEAIEYPEKLFFLGQAVKCRVTEADEEKNRLSLSLILDTMKPLGRREKGSQVLEVGQTYTGTISRVTEKGVEVKVMHKGLPSYVTLPTQHLTDLCCLAETLKSALSVGQEVKGMVWHRDVVTILTKKRSLVDSWSDLPKSISDYEVGKVVPGVVQLVKQYGVFLRVPGLDSLVLAPTRLLQDYFVQSASDLVEVGQTMMCKVVEVDEEQGKITVNTSASAMVGEEWGELVREWLEQVGEVGGKWPGVGLGVGSLLSGKVTRVTEFGVMLDIGGVQGIVTNSNLGGQKSEVGDMLTGVVMFVDQAVRVVELVCEGSLVSRVTARTSSVEGVKVGSVVRGQVELVKTDHSLAMVCLTHPRGLSGLVGYLGTRRNINDLAGVEVEERREVTVVVKEVTSRGELVLVLEREIRKKGKPNKRQRTESESISPGKRARGVSESDNLEIVKKNKPAVIEEPLNVIEGVDDCIDVLAVAASIDSSENPEPKSKKKKKKVDKSANTTEPSKPPLDLKSKSADPGWDFTATRVTLPAWKSSSIWSDEEVEEEEEGEKKHVSKAEAKRMKRVEEEEAARREQRVLDGEVDTPTTEEEFERLVVASPDSSLVWVQYMVCCMQGGELDKARAVAKRALGRINFRMEEERLNVFLAWLNLENTFGTPEALEVVLKEALQCCDQYKVYSQLAQVYSQSGKLVEAEKTYKVMVRKFSKEKEVWVKYGIFNYKNNKLSDGRFLLQRSLQSLDKRDHLEITSKFAQIEFRFGDPERGKTMFETILSNYPKRTDLWAVYVDQLVKTGDTEAGRALYRRMATLGLQAKKMKYLFKKWLDFESVHGSEAGVSEVKLAAQKYLEGKGGGGTGGEDVEME